MSIYERDLLRRLLEKATKDNNLESVKFLSENGADVNVLVLRSEEGSILAMAVENNNLEMVKFLVEKGANLNKKDYWNKTPLMNASEKGYLKIVRFLVRNGACLETKTSTNYKNAHDLAQMNMHTGTANFLKKKTKEVMKQVEQSRQC